jgi:putative flippase GtrA
MGSKKRNLIRELITFNIVGIINTAVTYIVYSFFVFIGIDYRLALILEYCLGIGLSFTLHRKFTFRHTEPVSFRMVFSMIGSYLVVLCINFFLLSFLVEKLHFNKYFGQLIALSISVAFSFMAQKFIVFRKKETDV